MRRAYSYIRFSTPEQIKGDSLRRQTALSDAYCQRHSLILDTSLSLTDLGVSAFRGKNADTGNLAAFLEGIQSGKVPKGSVLILENLDRLTRNEIGEALTLFIGILGAGIEIVTVSPERKYTRANINDLPVIIEAIMTFCLGHEESRKKSARLSEAWTEKRVKAKSAPIAIRAPNWIKKNKDTGKYEIRVDLAKLVKRIFDMADEGHSISSITITLNGESCKGFSGKGLAQSAVGLLLRSRTVLGEYHPHTGRYGTRRPVADPIPGYYPRIIEDDQFDRVQRAIQGRRAIRGRMGKDLANLFSGLVRDAHDGHKMTMVQKSSKRLVSDGAIRGLPGCRYLTMDYNAFEAAFLTFVSELKVSDIIPTEAKVSKVETLSGKLETINHKISQIQAKIDQADPDETDILLDTLQKQSKQRKEILADLDRAKQEETSDEAETLGECIGLAKLLHDCGDDERLDLRRKIRQRIRSLVSEIWVKTTEHEIPKRKRMGRYQEVQVHFKTGTMKSFGVMTGGFFIDDPIVNTEDFRRTKA